MPETDAFDPRAFHARHSLAAIVACSENGVIGREGGLPWHLPGDLRHFMRSTRGCAVVMGRKTFDSLDAPLPHRLNIVVSRSMPEPQDPAVRIVRDLDGAIELAREARMEAPVWIAGGGTIYEQAMGRVDLIVRTLVHTRVEGDTHFPEIDTRLWRLAHAQEHRADDRHRLAFTIQWWVRTPGSGALACPA